MIDAAIALCDRINSIEGDVSSADAALLVNECTAALSSPEVAESFVTTVNMVCSRSEANRAACGSAGSIPAVVAAISTHGAASARISAKGCAALGRLAWRYAVNADAIVSTGGGLSGLDAICSAMGWHENEEEVQKQACYALLSLAMHSGPATLESLRNDGSLPFVLHTAKAQFPADDRYGVKYWADLALAKLEPPAVKVMPSCSQRLSWLSCCRIVVVVHSCTGAPRTPGPIPANPTLVALGHR